ncbi:MAG: Rpn family recombination-promoting nuclease/putative transposase [Cytophagales bacterium]|nr:MAG: Rpn family recombination-promoting nuclease/putative transposase [Cytophagales bacterium]
MIPKHIHDRFFKEAFSRSDVVADFIQAYLPSEFSQQVNPNTLTRLQDSYVDDDLSQYYVDLLFSVEYSGQPITIALLLEHKSYPEEYPHFQLNQYQLNYWRDQLKEQQALRPVVPIIIYHGQGKWKKRPPKDYFQAIDSLLSCFIPDFDYYLINLTEDTGKRFELLRSSYAKLTAGLLKTVRQKHRLTKMLDQLRQVINDLVEEQTGEQFVKTAFIYIHWASKLTSTEIIGIFRSISQKTETTAMSAAETLIKQGMQQGMQQGEYQVTLKYIKGMLRLGMDAKTIANAFDLPLKTVELYIATIKEK